MITLKLVVTLNNLEDEGASDHLDFVNCAVVDKQVLGIRSTLG